MFHQSDAASREPKSEVGLKGGSCTQENHPRAVALALAGSLWVMVTELGAANAADSQQKPHRGLDVISDYVESSQAGQ